MSNVKHEHKSEHTHRWASVSRAVPYEWRDVSQDSWRWWSLVPSSLWPRLHTAHHLGDRNNDTSDKFIADLRSHITFLARSYFDLSQVKTKSVIRILMCMDSVTDEHRCSIMSRIIRTLSFPVFYLRGVNPEHMVLMDREDRRKRI